MHVILNLFIVFVFASSAVAAELPSVTVCVPGPRSLSYLPVDLAPRIAADRAEGVRLRIHHTSGGGVALSRLANRDTEFVVTGAAAQMSMRAKGGDVVIVAALNDVPLKVLMVRSALKGKIRRIADLRGKTVGVATSSLSSKTMAQQLLELLLKNNGVDPAEVKIIPTGQSWVEQSSVIAAGVVDAIMGDEPFATRLLEEKKVFVLMNLADPAVERQIPGGRFLHAALATRSDLVVRQPEKVAKMVAVIRRSLAWMARKSPEEIVAALDIQDRAEREALVAALKKYPRLYSADGAFSTSQLQNTERFFRAGCSPGSAAAQLGIELMVKDVWAGRKP